MKLTSYRLDPGRQSYKWWVLGNIMLGTFMAVLDSTIVNVGLPKIMATFGVSISKIQWIITAYLLAIAVVLPAAAWLADRYGYKRLYFIGLFGFTAGSFLCGTAWNEDVLIASRIIQGIGGGLIQPLGLAIITREFPPRQRGLALGFWAISSAASISFGPLIGGWLVDTFSWHLIFDVNVPLGIIGLAATIVIQREYRNPNVGRFDRAGFISAVIFLPLTLFALTEANAPTNAEGWNAPYILACLAAAFVAFVFFVVTELTVEEPLLDLKLLGDRNFGITMAVLFIFSIGMFGSTFLLPLYLQNAMDYSALQAGAVFLPVGIIQGAVSPVSGWLSNKVNAKLLIAGGFLLLAYSFWLNGHFTALTPRHHILFALYIRGFAMGMLFSVLNTVSLIRIPKAKMAQASGISNTVRQLAGSLSVAILTTLLTSRQLFNENRYGQVIDPDSPVYVQTVRNLTGYARQHGEKGMHTPAQQAQAILDRHIEREAYIQAIDDDFLLSAFITGICVAPVLWPRVHDKDARKGLEKA